MKYFIITLILVSNALAQLANATSLWVSGAWVNVRESATTSALVIAQLPTNTEVTLIKTEDKFSLVEFKQNNSTKQGFIANTFLSNSTLTLADIRKDQEGDKVRKTFWISPSLENLFDVGEYYNRLYADNNATYSDKPTAPYKAKVLPEYEAMKNILKSGIVIKNQELAYQSFLSYISDLKKQFMKRKEDYDSQYKTIIDFLEQYQKKYKPQPSFFKSEKEVISANATFDNFSSYLQTPVSISNISLPKWECWPWDDNCKYRGMWDIGGLSAKLDKDIYLSAINLQGLIASYSSQQKEYDFSKEDRTHSDFRRLYSTDNYTHIRNTPKIKNPILWFYTTTQLPFTRAKVNSFELKKDAYAIPITEIDINNDNISDFARIGNRNNSGELLFYTPDDMEYAYIILVNINGSWRLFYEDKAPFSF